MRHTARKDLEHAHSRSSGRTPARLLPGTWRGLRVLTMLAALALLAICMVDAVSRGQAVSAHARAAASALDQVAAAFDASDEAAERRYLKVAEGEVADAQSALNDPVLRASELLPFVRTYLVDARRLVASARLVTRIGHELTTLKNSIRGTDGFLFWPEEVDLTTLRSAAPIAEGIIHDVEKARGLLHGVTFAPAAGSMMAARRSALSNLATVDDSVRAFSKPAALLNALGDTTPRRYLVIATTSGNTLASGGSPVTTAMLTFRHGDFVVTPGPAVTARARWRSLPSDPWVAGAEPQDLTAAERSPAFPIAAEESLRWFFAVTGSKADGVVRVDSSALQRVLNTIPASSRPPGVTPETPAAAFSLAVAGFPSSTTPAAQQVLLSTLRRLVDTDKTGDRLTALGMAAANGDLSVYSRTPSVQALASAHGFAGWIRAGGQDVIGVVATGQTASVPVQTTQDVTVRTATTTVTRTVTLDLPSAGSVVEYFPSDARNVRVRADGGGTAPLIRSFTEYDGQQGREIRLSQGRHVLRADYQLQSAAKGATPYTVSVVGPPGTTTTTKLRVRAPGYSHDTKDPRWHRSGDVYDATLTQGGQHLLSLAALPAEAGWWHWIWHGLVWLVGWMALVVAVVLASRRLRRSRRRAGGSRHHPAIGRSDESCPEGTNERSLEEAGSSRPTP